MREKCGFVAGESQLFSTIKYYLSGPVTLLTAIFGTVGSLLSFLTLGHRSGQSRSGKKNYSLFFSSMKNVFNHLLAVLCLVDLLVILTNMIHSVKTMTNRPAPDILLSIG